jgi:hypothetical protein
MMAGCFLRSESSVSYYSMRMQAKLNETGSLMFRVFLAIQSSMPQVQLTLFSKPKVQAA